MGGIPNNPFFNNILTTSCSDLIIRTQLFSPIQPILNTVKVNDILSIALLGKNGPCVATSKNGIVGTIVHKNLLLLIECLNKGKEFNAIVRNISGGSCAITIKAKEEA